MELKEKTFEGFKEATISKQNKVIHGIAILRSTSKNGRTYSPLALQQVAEMVSGSRAFINHGTRNERDMRDLLGGFQRGRLDGNVVRADLSYLGNHSDLLESIFELPGVCGFSVHCDGHVIRGENRTDIVEEITAFHSADLVASPASTSNLFEALGKNAEDREAITILEETKIKHLFNEMCGLLESQEKPDTSHNAGVDIGVYTAFHPFHGQDSHGFTACSPGR